jgi:hypothetical protein
MKLLCGLPIRCDRPLPFAIRTFEGDDFTDVLRDRFETDEQGDILSATL